MSRAERNRVRSMTEPRVRWVPGDVWTGPTFDFREATPCDLQTWRESLQDRVGSTIVARLEEIQSGIVRLALRSVRVLAGFALSEHTAELNEVHGLWVHPRYTGTTLYADLILLAALEVPEAPLRVWVPETDVAAQCALAREKCVATETNDGRIRFDRRALAPTVAQVCR